MDIHLQPIKWQKAYMLVELIDKYYEHYCTGGSLHIVLDDGNYGKGYVASCLQDAEERNDYWGKTIGLLLLNFDEEEQEQIIERPFEIYEKLYE